MEDITDFVKVYIDDLRLLEETTNDIAMSLEDNIKDEAPYDQGRLRRSIRVDTRLYDTHSLVTGYFDEGLAPHGVYVLFGSGPVEGKPMKMPWGWRTKRKAIPGDDFLGRGLERTLEAYK